MPEENQGIRSQMPLIIVIMLGMFLAILNQTLLNVAIPHLINEFQVDASTAQWLMTGYLLVNGILVPLSAYLIERFGTRNLFIWSMIFFTIGSLLCGLAPSYSILLIGRLIQAIGAGIMMPLIMTIILYIFPPEQRGKGMGIFGLGMVFAPAIGPTLSGWVIEHYSWRWLFNGIVPLAVLVLILASMLLKDVKERSRPKFSILGALYSTIGFGSFLYGLSEAGTKSWSDPVVQATTFIGILFILIFVYHEMHSENPMLNFSVFRKDMFTLSTIINIVVTIAMYSGMYLVPIYLQNLRGFSALESGLLMLPGAIIMGVMSPVSGILFDKFGPRILAIVGLTITAITTWEFTTLTLETTYTKILFIYMARMFGMSLLMMPIMTAGMNQLSKEETSHGTAMSNTMRQIAGSFGISLFTTIFTMRTDQHVARLQEQTNTMDPLFQQMFHSLSNGIASMSHILPDQAQQMATIYLSQRIGQLGAVSGINDAFVWATIITVVAIVLSFFLRDVRRDMPKNTAEEKQPTKRLPEPRKVQPTPQAHNKKATPVTT